MHGHPSQVSSCSWALQILAEALSLSNTCAAISSEVGSFEMQVSCRPAGSLLMNYTHTLRIKSTGKKNIHGCFQLLARKPRALWSTSASELCHPALPAPMICRSFLMKKVLSHSLYPPCENANIENNQHVSWRVLPWQCELSLIHRESGSLECKLSRVLQR